jgi:DNA-binding MarR family transcriptional regulator
MESPRFGVVLRDTSRLFLRILRVYAERYKISLNQYLVLRDVLDRPGSSQREISEHVNIAEPTIAATVEALVKRKLLTRTRSEEDRRQFRLYLTREGKALTRRLVRHVVDINRAAERGMTDREARTLRELLMQAHENLTELAVKRKA